MSLSESGPKIKSFFDRMGKGDVYIALLILFVGLGGFGLGRLSKITSRVSEVNIEDVAVRFGSGVVAGVGETATKEPVITQKEGVLVGSKNSDKYHFPWCSGALRMKEENKVWFSSVEDARASGYGPAKNCKGLE